MHGESSTGTIVAGNTIGTRQDGQAALPNAGRGVAVVGSSGVTIGTAVTGGDNTISGTGWMASTSPAEPCERQHRDRSRPQRHGSFRRRDVQRPRRCRQRRERAPERSRAHGGDTIAIRRGPYVVWSNLAQYFGAPGTGYGNVVAGDWDGEGRSSFGLYYQDGRFYRLNDLAWHTEAYILQQLGQPLGTPTTPDSWRPGGS